MLCSTASSGLVSAEACVRSVCGLQVAVGGFLSYPLLSSALVSVMSCVSSACGVCNFFLYLQGGSCRALCGVAGVVSVMSCVSSVCGLVGDPKKCALCHTVGGSSRTFFLLVHRKRHLGLSRDCTRSQATRVYEALIYEGA